MRLTWLIEADLPAGDAGEITRELEAFATRLVQFNNRNTDRRPGPVMIALLGPDQVVVDADALIRLQAKAG